MKVNPKKIPLCKICKSPFVKYNFIQNKCVDCIIKLENEKYLVKGTVAFKSAKVEIKIGEHRSALQDKINLLARMIDSKFYNKCIDCNLKLLKQVHGAHFHAVKNNGHIRFNLHNIHSATSQCNNYSNTHLVGYREGIIERYGKNYLDFILDLQVQYRDVKLNAVEIKEKLQIASKITRTFDTYQFTDGIQARNKLNLIIGIYKIIP